MKIKIAITDCRIGEDQLRRLLTAGFRVITLPRSKRLSQPIESHTDMLLASLGGELISTADYAEEAPFVFTDLWELMRNGNRKLVFTADEISPTYPYDCRLNIISFGSLLFCKTDTVSEYIKHRAEKLGFTIISIKQGYPACVTLKLGEGAAITADRGMARVLEEHGIEVTLIEEGHIELPPYDYGFIGGCAGVYGDKIYFAGDPATHPSYEKIIAACGRVGLTPISLGIGRLRDLGGILFVEGNSK